MTLPTPRRRMSQKRRQHIFTEHCTAHNIAPCCLCGEPIHRHDDDWQIEHIRALGLLGKDTNTNCAPAHTRCAIEKTHKLDLPMIRKAKRQAAAGLAKFATPGLANKPCSRAFWRHEGAVYDWKQGRYTLR
jgi:hypothetical protein